MADQSALPTGLGVWCPSSPSFYTAGPLRRGSSCTRLMGSYRRNCLPGRENFATGDRFKAVGVIGIAGNTDRIEGDQPFLSAASLVSSGGKSINSHLVWRRADASTKARKPR